MIDINEQREWMGDENCDDPFYQEWEEVKVKNCNNITH